MNDLNTIAIRVMRGGKWVATFVNDLAFLTAEELENMGRHVREPILAALKDSSAWHYDESSSEWQWGEQ